VKVGIVDAADERHEIPPGRAQVLEDAEVIAGGHDAPG
jgi:hypothetical protein